MLIVVDAVAMGRALGYPPGMITARPLRELMAATRFMVLRLGAVLFFGGFTTWAGAIAPDFKLTDTNPNSVRYNSLVSPRDYLLQVSGYYFGSAG